MREKIKQIVKFAGHRNSALTFALGAAALIGPTIASANPIIGNLVLSGHGTQVIAVNSSQIDFDFSGTVSDTFPPVAVTGTVDGNGDSALFDVTNASTQSFAAATGSAVTLHDLDRASQPIGATVGPGLPLANFITFASQPTWHLDLTELLPGAFASADCFKAMAAAGDTCSLSNSPFNLSNIAGGQVIVSFSFLGTANDGAGNITNISGEFGSTFSNTTLQAIVTAIVAGKAVVTSGSATVAATAVSTPEPSSTSLLLIGITLLAGVFATTKSEAPRIERRKAANISLLASIWPEEVLKKFATMNPDSPKDSTKLQGQPF